MYTIYIELFSVCSITLPLDIVVYTCTLIFIFDHTQTFSMKPSLAVGIAEYAFLGV